MNGVWHDSISDQIRVASGARSQDFPPLSLVSVATGDVVSIRMRNSDANVLLAPYTDFCGQDGAPFTSVADLQAYLGGEFGKKRSVGTPFGTAAVAAADLIPGLPLTVSRITGQLLPARADAYTLSFVAGLAPAAIAQGFTTTPIRGAFTLADWSAVTGEPSLHPGAPYFLDEAGGLTISPFFVSGMTATRVGIAASTVTLTVDPTDPILL